MPDWKDAARVRHDDPYHAWSYDRRNGSAPDGFCPALIEIPRSDKENCTVTKGQLIAALKELRTALASEEKHQFQMSEYDKQHLIKSLVELIDGPGGDDCEAPDYARLYLVYFDEKELFPKSDAYWQSPAYRILYVGQTVELNKDALDPRRLDAGALTENAASLVVIDDSIGFLNAAFFNQTADGARSKFEEIWLQTRETRVDGQIKFGAQLTGDEITKLYREEIQGKGLTELEVYSQPFNNSAGAEFKIVDWSSEEHQPLAFGVSHGTHVTQTALSKFEDTLGETAGNLKLFGVAVPTDVTQDSSGSAIGSYALAALRQAMLWGDLTSDGEDKPPLVINFSFGFSAGAKDGTDDLAVVIARLLEARNALNRVTKLVVPMGNSFYQNGVAELELPAGAEGITLNWIISPQDHTPNYLEFFAHGGALDIEICPPGDPGLRKTVTLDDTAQDTNLLLRQDAQQPIASWSQWEKHAPGWTTRGFLAVAPTTSFDEAEICAPSGIWQVRISNKSGAPVTLRALVQRDDAPGTYPFFGKQSYLETPDATQKSTEADGEFHADWNQLRPNGPIKHEFTGSVLAAIDSEHVYVAGAGMGDNGDCEDQDVVDPSPYGSVGPRLPGKDGVDVLTLTDRNRYFRGVYGAGTYSGTEVALSGSSIAAPILSGWLAAELIKDPAVGRPAKPRVPNNPTHKDKLRRQRWGAKI